MSIAHSSTENAVFDLDIYSEAGPGTVALVQRTDGILIRISTLPGRSGNTLWLLGPDSLL